MSHDKKFLFTLLLILGFTAAGMLIIWVRVAGIALAFILVAIFLYFFWRIWRS